MLYTACRLYILFALWCGVRLSISGGEFLAAGEKYFSIFTKQHLRHCRSLTTLFSEM